MEVTDVTGCRCHEAGTLCPHCAEQVRRLIRGEKHDWVVPSEPPPPAGPRAAEPPPPGHPLSEVDS